MEELQTELQTIKTDSMEQFNKFITAQQIKEVKIEFENVFQKSLNIWTNINKFTDFKNGDIFNLHAFTKNK